MTALTVMGYGCAASHRDWRRITLGSSGSPNQIGYIDLAPWGSQGLFGVQLTIGLLEPIG